MKKIFGNLQKNDDSGEVVVEAMILVIIIICAIFFTINIASVYYNRIIVASVAQEAASGASIVYGSEGREPFVGYVPTDYFKNRNIYRHLLSNKLEDVTAEKARWYGSYLLNINEFATAHDTGISDYIETRCEKNERLGCMMVYVSVDKEYPLFIANPMSIFGIDPKYVCSATASAVCYDPIHQINLMALFDEFAGGVNGASKVTDAADKILSIISKIMGSFN